MHGVKTHAAQTTLIEVVACMSLSASTEKTEGEAHRTLAHAALQQHIPSYFLNRSARCVRVCFRWVSSRP